MSTPRVSTIDVLVVGAGPTGLVATIELLRRQVNVRLIEKLPQPAGISKASGIWPRTVEIFMDMGIADQFLAVGQQITKFALRDQHRQNLLSLELKELDTPHPALLGVEQYRTEAILTDHLHALGGEIERQVELLSLTETAEGVLAVIQHADGLLEQVHAQYVVGADGAHSTVRHQLKVDFPGQSYPLDYLLGHVEIDWELPRDELYTFLSDRGSVFVTPLPENRWFMAAELAGDQRERVHDGVPTTEDLQLILDERTGVQSHVHDPKWTSFFHIHHRLVEHYRLGRVFLAGDAAHIHSPAAAQGMNTGIQDAYNLGWKLALVCKQQACPSLLDSYEAERRPVAQTVVHITDGMQRAMNLRGTPLLHIRNHMMKLINHAGFLKDHFAETLSETSYSYSSGPLAFEHHAGTGLFSEQHPGVSREASRKFQEGPVAGVRAPDARLCPVNQLYDLLRGERFHLLLFTGSDTADQQLAHLREVAVQIAGDYGDLLDVHLIHRGEIAASDATLPYKNVADVDGCLHSRYGAVAPCAYLIRPDWHILGRCQPVSAQLITACLERAGVTCSRKAELIG